MVRSMRAREKPAGSAETVQYVLFLPMVESEEMRNDGFDGVKILTAEDLL